MRLLSSSEEEETTPITSVRNKRAAPTSLCFLGPHGDTLGTVRFQFFSNIIARPVMGNEDFVNGAMTSYRIQCDSEHCESISSSMSCHTSHGVSHKSHVDIEVNGINGNIKLSSMYRTFQNWALKNYGDSGKTKTVTQNKYLKIVRILTGEEQFTAENSKFRFWVKAKGFRLSEEGDVDKGLRILLVPSKHMVSRQ